MHRTRNVSENLRRLAEDEGARNSGTSCYTADRSPVLIWQPPVDKLISQVPLNLYSKSNWMNIYIKPGPDDLIPTDNSPIYMQYTHYI